MTKILAVTGHRPNKLGGYKSDAQRILYRFAILQLGNFKPNKVITGMALGWDQAIAKAARDMKVPFIAAIPFVGQENAWFESVQEQYRDLISYACEIKVVCEGGYEPIKMQKRNEWMVDNSTELLALWNGSSGGTANCVKYAMKKPAYKITNVWGDFK